MTFGIIKQLHESTRDSVCVIDGKPIKKGDNVILLGDKVAKQRITVWEAAHIAPACANKVENWLANQPTTTAPTTAPTTSKGYGDLSITEAFKLIANGNQRRDSRIDELEASNTRLSKLVTEQQKTLDKCVEQINGLNSAVRLPESSPSNPPRPAADAENKPVNCLGIKTNGQACKQTQNRLQPNGYCGQHQGQSGDSERAVLDSHAEEVTEAQQQDIPAVPADLLELLG
jgi:hypothetical protein